MKKSEKNFVVGFFGVIGVLLFLAGIANVLSFTTGVLLAVVCWVVAGYLSRCRSATVMTRPAKKKSRRKRR
jgi:hypothetical protein